MGEILDALRRAEKEFDERRTTPRPAPPPEPAGPSHPPAPRFGDPREPDPLRPPGPTTASFTERERPAPPSPVQRVVISLARDAHWPARALLLDESGPIVEGYRQFALRVHAALEARRARGVAVTSPLRGEGKTTTACNLAIALAAMSSGGRVALVDLDLRRPNVAIALGVPVRVGIDSVLAGEARLSEARIATDLPDLDLYAVLERRRDAHGLLARARLGELVAELETAYDAVIFDTPPTLLAPDATLVLRHVSTCVAVARAGVTRLAAYRNLLTLIPREKLIGGFLNEADVPRHGGHYEYYGAESGPEKGARRAPWKARKART